MEILILLLGIEFSGINGMNAEYYIDTQKDDYTYFNNQLFITFNAEIQLLQFFYIKGTARILMYGRSLEYEYHFFPCALSSFIETGLKYKGFIIGYRHICIHPVTPFIEYGKMNLFVDQSADEIFLKYETKAVIF